MWRLAQRLACTVVSVEIAPESVGPGRELYKLLDEAKGRPLQRERLAAVLAEAARDMPKDAEGIELAFYRDITGTGIVLNVRLPPASRRTGKSWRASKVFHLTRHSSWGWSRECTLVAARRPGYWMPVLDKLQDMLNTAPYTAIDGRVSLLLKPK